MFRIIAGIGLIQVLAVMVNLARSKALAVLLGPKGVGVVSVIDQVVQFTAYLSAFSLPLAAVKFLSRSHSQGQAAFQRIYAGLFLLLLTGSAAGTAALAAVALVRPSWLGVGLANLGPTVALAALSVPAMTLMGFFTNVFAAARRTRTSDVMTLVTNGALTAAACCGLLAGGVPALYTATAAMNVLLVGGTAWSLRRSMGLSLRFRLAELLADLRANRDIAPFACYLCMGATAYSVALLVARTTLLEGDGTAAGLLQAALALSGAIGLALNPANGLYLTPLMNRAIAPEEKVRAALEFHKKLLFLLAGAGMAIVLFPELILHLLFSGQFVAAAPHLLWFVAGQCLLQLAGIYQAVLIGLDDLLAYAAVTCGGYLFIALLCRVLGPPYGVAGIGYAFFIGSALLLGMTMLRSARRFGVSCPRGLHAMTLYVLAGLLLAGAAVTRSDAGFGTRIAIGLCFAGTLPSWLTKQERASLQVLWRKMLPA